MVLLNISDVADLDLFQVIFLAKIYIMWEEQLVDPPIDYITHNKVFR